MDCGGDDNNGTTPTSGSAGSSTGGKGGGAGAATTGGGAGQGGGGKGGSAGTAGSGGKGGTGGTGGSAGTAGSAGSGGAKPDAGDAAPESSTSEASTSDVKSDSTAATEAGDAGATDATPDTTAADASDAGVTFAQVTAIFTAHCVSCHQPHETGPQLLDLQTAAGLYTRLTTPLASNQEGQCGFPDGGTDDAGDGATPPNRQAIVPTDTSNSLLYLKISGTQPTGCGQRMPRVNLIGDDGGPAGSTGCNTADGGASANCLSQADLDTIGNWITQGATQN
jgi:hypothetical protein